MKLFWLIATLAIILFIKSINIQDMAKDDKIINGAIALEKGKTYEPDTMVACLDYPYVCILLRYEGDTAVVECKHRGELRFLKSEMFSVKRVREMCIHYKSLGVYPPDGIEIEIIRLNIKPKNND